MMMTTQPPPQTPRDTASDNTPMPRPPLAPLAARGFAPFLALFKKELREFAWLLPLAWVALLFVYFIAYADTQAFHLAAEPTALMNSSLLAINPIFCAAIGFLLGFVPYYAERSFDRWAFLAHRPLSPARRFLYKTAADALLYAAAVGVPMLAFITWTLARHVNVPVFHWRMLLPHAADFSLGLVALAAGSLAAQRNARRFGTRLFPLISVVAVLAAHFMFNTFSAVIAVHAATLALFLTAAWGAALTHGDLPRAPRPARAAETLALLIACLVPALLINLLATLPIRDATDVFKQRLATVPYASPIMLPGGKVAIQVGQPAPELWQWHLETLDGHLIPSEGHHIPYFGQTLSVLPLNGRAAAAHNYRDPFSLIVPFDQNHYSELLLSDLPVPPKDAYFYYFKHERTIQALDSAGRRVASLNPTGLTASDPPQTWDTAGDFPFLTPHAFYFGNNKTLRSIPISDDTLVDARLDTGRSEPTLTLVAQHHVYFFHATDMKLLVALPRRTLTGLFSLRVAALEEPAGYLLQYTPEVPGGTYYFDRFDPAGKPLAAITVDPDTTALGHYLDASDDFHTFPLLTSGTRKAGLISAFGLPVFILPTLTPAVPAGKLAEYIPIALPSVLAVNLLAALVTFWLTRRFKLRPPAYIFWTLAALVLGPMLLIVFSATHDRPVRLQSPRAPSNTDIRGALS